MFAVSFYSLKKKGVTSYLDNLKSIIQKFTMPHLVEIGIVFLERKVEYVKSLKADEQTDGKTMDKGWPTKLILNYCSGERRKFSA